MRRLIHTASFVSLGTVMPSACPACHHCTHCMRAAEVVDKLLIHVHVLQTSQVVGEFDGGGAERTLVRPEYSSMPPAMEAMSMCECTTSRTRRKALNAMVKATNEKAEFYSSSWSHPLCTLLPPRVGQSRQHLV